MGMVVLNTEPGKVFCRCPFLGVTCGEVIRVKIMDECLRPKPEKPLIDTDGCFKMLEGFQILHVPDMLTEEAVLIPRETERIF